jgi:hypothetical protein
MIDLLIIMCMPRWHHEVIAMLEGIPMVRLIMTAIAAFAGIVSAIHLVVPIGHAEQEELSIGKYRIMADFPCRPNRQKQVIGRTETGDEISQTTFVCSQGVITYSLSATEYSEQVLKSLPADVWVNRTLDGVRSQPRYTLKSSTRQPHQTFPAIRAHFSDSRVPPLDMARLSVLTDAGIVVIGGSWPSGSPEPSPAIKFTDSLTITSDSSV